MNKLVAIAAFAVAVAGCGTAAPPVAKPTTTTAAVAPASVATADSLAAYDRAHDALHAASNKFTAAYGAMPDNATKAQVAAPANALSAALVTFDGAIRALPLSGIAATDAHTIIVNDAKVESDLKLLAESDPADAANFSSTVQIVSADVVTARASMDVLHGDLASP